MNKTPLTLHERRAQLVLNAQAQRECLAQNVEVFRTPLALIDHGVMIAGFIKRHPFFLIGLSTLLIKFLPKRFNGQVSRGYLIYNLLIKLINKYLS